MFRRVHLVIGVAAVFALTAASAQAQEATLSHGSPSLLGKVSIVEPVTSADQPEGASHENSAAVTK